MMGLQKWFKTAENHSLNLQESLFRLLVTIGLFGLAVAIVVGIIVGEDKLNTVPLTIAFFIFAGISYFSLHYGKIQLGAIIIGGILIYLVLPYNFLTSGGIYGGAPIYLLFGMLYVCLVIEGKVKYIFLASCFLVSGVCYYIAYRNLLLLTDYMLDRAYINSMMSLVIIEAGACVTILFQNAVFRSQTEIARKQKKEIEELNHAQNRFFSSMSHEIRTPINTIIGLNEMILREDVSDEVAADAMNIQGVSKMLLSLINDFLDMSKIESGKMDIVPVNYNVGDMLSDIVNTIWMRAKEKGLEFHVDVDQAVPAHLYGDEVRIRQVLLHVLNNAVKYTRSGSVTLSIQSKEVASDYVQIVYSVTDTGMGIRQESIPHLYNTFKKVGEENSYIEGTGLGLSITKQLVELMGGDIAVNSVYTKGSTFVITLPQKIVDEGKIGNYAFKTKRTLGVSGHYRQSFEAPEAHILIVDDNDQNLMVAEGLLRDTKVQIETVTSAAECLGRTLQKKYDVILMDHFMPGMDGIECLHAIRTQTQGINQNTPVVILTANADGEDQELYRREGFDGYLSKPINSIQLEEELLKHLPKEMVSMTDMAASVGVVENPIVEYKKKRSVMISTDSVCDLPETFLEKYQIAVMPFRLHTEGGEFLDGIEAEADGIVSYMSEKGKLVRSVSPDVTEYEEFFAEQLTKAQYIIHFATAKKASDGYGNAEEASKTFDNVIVVDSGHLSSGMGLIVLGAAECAEDGLSADAILDKIEDMKRRTRTSFIVESTEYLARSGRIAPKINELCKVFMLHPVLVLRNSSISVGAIRVGTKDYVRRKYIASILNVMGTIDTRILFITYAGLTKEELEDIKEQVQSKVAFQNIICQKASSAISSHCGPGTFGLLFMMK